MTRLHLRYFALLRDQAGRHEETVETSAATPAALYAELAARHAFTLTAGQVRVAVNGDFVPADRPLKGDDTVVFIPPVSGG